MRIVGNRADALLLPGILPTSHLSARRPGDLQPGSTYCFFLRDALPSRFRICKPVLAILRQLVETHATSAEVVVAWQGAEPMVGLDFFRRFVRWPRHWSGQRIAHPNPGQRHPSDDAWGAFYAEHGFLVILLIMAPRGVSRRRWHGVSARLSLREARPAHAGHSRRVC